MRVALVGGVVVVVRGGGGGGGGYTPPAASPSVAAASSAAAASATGCSMLGGDAVKRRCSVTPAPGEEGWWEGTAGGVSSAQGDWELPPAGTVGIILLTILARTECNDCVGNKTNNHRYPNYNHDCKNES